MLGLKAISPRKTVSPLTPRGRFSTGYSAAYSWDQHPMAALQKAGINPLLICAFKLFCKRTLVAFGI